MSKAEELLESTSIYQYIGKIWHYPLFQMGGNHLIVGNLILAIALTWLGLRYRKALSARISDHIYRKNHYDKDTAHTIEKVVSYFIIVLYITLILEISQIPFSAFAFLGGAVALSIGLGAQTLINNFLSGLMMMVEKSLKIGDVVEIDGVVGIVHSIGARSTHIKTTSGADVVIPNSNFVQNIFVKLNTHKDAIKHKAELTINDEGLDANKIKQDILDVMEAVPHVLNTPVAEMYLSEIRNKRYKYIVYFYTSISRYNKIEFVQDEINTALVTRWGKNDVELNYLREMTIKKEK